MTSDLFDSDLGQTIIDPDERKSLIPGHIFQGTARKFYIQSLQKADNGDFTDLIQFAIS